MAKLPTKEENGKMILSIYEEFGCRPNEVLRSNNFVSWAARRRMRMSDIADGLEYAVEAGWISETQNGSLALTELGYEMI